jgi:hypothetical protein
MAKKPDFEPQPDFRVTNHGTIWTFVPLTPRAAEIIEEFGLEDWQRLPDGFAVDHRPARALAEQLEGEGFIVLAQPES